MANYAKTNIGNEGRVELHDTLSLTGAEISINKLPAGANVPFIHSHKNNEEIYGIIAGKGKAIIDDEEINLTTGDWLRISPAGKRQFFASKDSELTYICIQVKEKQGFVYSLKWSPDRRPFLCLRFKSDSICTEYLSDIRHRILWH